jgi:hypothetical protein
LKLLFVNEREAFMAILNPVRSPKPIAPIPAWITSEEGREQYLLGISWFHTGKADRLPEPLTEAYLLCNLE